MTWNHDLTTIPLDRRFLVETRKGEVLISVFNKPTKTAPAGWFSGVGPVECIVAWQDLPAASGGPSPIIENLNERHAAGERV